MVVDARRVFQVCLFVFLPLLVQAEAVFEGEFVIESADSVYIGENSSIEQLGISAVKTITDNVALIRSSKKSNLIQANSSNDVSSFSSLNESDGQQNVREVSQADYDFCKKIVKSGLASSCSPNYYIKISDIPNDEKFDQLWGLSSSLGIGATDAWDVTTGDPNVVVAVIDTGIDYNHPDLKDNMWVNQGEIPNNGIDDDGNGYIDDVYGVSAVGSNKGDPLDYNGHGTHVAGVIGAKGNNALGVTGVNWNVKLIGGRFLNANGSGSLAGAIEVINYITKLKKQGVNVVAMNNSWGGGNFSQPMFNAIRAAMNAGILFVAASGNEGNNNDLSPSYPADYDLSNVISVGAIGRDFKLASFSNYGANSVDIAAPGVAIVSTYLNGQYKSLSGTSMATPYVTGAIALAYAKYPEAKFLNVKSSLLKTATEKDNLAGKVNGSHMLNLASFMLLNPEDSQVVESCEYSFTKSTPSVTALSDEALVISKEDELNFKNIKLQFTFPFYGEKYTSLTVSPNGVLYFKPDNAADYKHSEQIANYSIAPFHSDLIFPKSHHGIRTDGNTDFQIITWTGRLYENIFGDDVIITAKLYPSGNVEFLYNFGSDQVAAIAGKNVTIGVAGGASDKSYVYAYNNIEFYDSMSLMMNTSCTKTYSPQHGDYEEDTIININDIVISAKNKKGNNSKKAIPNSLINIEMQGKGVGDVPLSLYLNGRQCAAVFSAHLNDGYASKIVRLPKIIKKYKSIMFASEGVQSNILKIKNVASVNKLRVKNDIFSKDCSAMIRQLSYE